MSPPIEIHTFCLGMWQTNCYLVRETASKLCTIIDAGFEPQPFIDLIRAENLEPQHILLTHAHLDHIAGVPALREAFPSIPILIHHNEADFLTNPELNLSAGYGTPITTPPADQLLSHNDQVALGNITLKVLETPGHSPGGITFYHAESHNAFVGDALFQNSIGRYDFPTSNGQTLIQSIKQQLMTLPGQTAVHPGHGPSTTIAQEQQHNPYLQM